ncbi:MAG: amidohydrolase family protein [Clostridiales bacterium]|nr:amidohydrolase family protein [Clostridiales bacterium]
MNTLIKNGIIVDGSGREPFAADVLIQDGVIAEVGIAPESAGENTVRLDAAGRYVTPGFVDIHRHCDYAAFKENFGDIELSQGVTTVVSGSCGLTPYPTAGGLSHILAPVMGDAPFEIPTFAAYVGALEKTSPPVNVAGMIGSCAVRAAVKGAEDSSPFSAPETEAARGMVSEAMERGALGISLGIMYLPEFFSTASEMARVAEAAAPYGGVITAPIRGEGDSLSGSVTEVIRVAREANLPLEISHFKCCGPENWGHGLERAIQIIEEARKGQDVTVDAYPYHGGATTLLSLFPAGFPRSEWGNPAAIEAALTKRYDDWDNYVLSLGFERILIHGRHLSESTDPYRLLSKVLTEEEGRTGVTVMSMSPQDVDTVIKLPYASIISDALYPADLHSAHPRLYSAFPRILKDFVRERQVLSLPEAVRKMTSMPARRLNIKKRGLLKPGYAADINIFALENIADNTDFSHGGLLASGMETVLVNGGVAWQGEGRVGNHGRVLYRQ